MKTIDDSVILGLYQQFGTQRKAAAALGISQTEVYRVMKKHGVVADGRKMNGKGWRAGGSPRKITDEQVKEAAATLSCAEIANKYHVDYMSVDRKLKRLRVHAVEGLGEGNRKRWRALSKGEYDPTISLVAVMEKDKGVCQICGLPVDKNDRNGRSIGPLYPTVDHIVSFIDGGSHTWDNVQLAHMCCNREKGGGK